ncbi:MAG: tyrosine-type recombinase/integrase [Bacilli bacterium]|nr:tyrosine-type recombinase/integrase [Bacilli bacterium]
MGYNEYIKKNKKISNTKHSKLKNGFGSISYLGEKRSRPFMLRASAMYDDVGKEKRKIIGYTDDYYSGIETLIRYNKDTTCIEKENITFAEIFKLWTEHEKRRNNSLPPEKRKKKAFADNYTSTYNNQCQNLYDIPITKLSIADIQDCVDSCEYGYSTKKYIKLLYGKLLKYSKFIGIPVDLDLAKMIDLGVPDVSDIHTFFTQKEKQKLWNNLGNRKIDPYKIIDTVLMEIYMGLRPTELLQLEVENINIYEKVAIGGIKSRAGIGREIPLHDRIIPLIESRMQNRYKYLITNKNGLKVNYRHYLDIYKQLMARLGMEHLPHDGRDTATTEMFNANVPPLIYKLIVGHTIHDVTEKHYIKITLKQKIDAINKIL